MNLFFKPLKFPLKLILAGLIDVFDQSFLVLCQNKESTCQSHCGILNFMEKIYTCRIFRRGQMQICGRVEGLGMLSDIQWNPLLTTSRIATTVAITTDLQIPVFFLYLSHVIYFYNNEYRKSLSSVITTTWSETTGSLGVKRKETQ